jgi:alcohol dehydrogenase class IV
MAEAAIEALHRGAPLAVRDPDDDEGRDRTLFGAYLAGAAFGVAGSSLHHKICHILGGLYDLPHAELHTAVLPHVAAFLTPALPEEFERIARALGDAPSAAEGLFDLATELGATATLRDIGLRESDLEGATARVLEQLPHSLPRQVDEASIARILQDAWAGRRPEPATSEL